MPPKSEHTSPVFRAAPPARIYLSVGGIGLLILALVSYGFYIGERMTSLDAPMMNAVSKIKLEAAITGLMIEEILANGIVGGLEENWEPLDTAVSTLRRLTETQADWKTALLPFLSAGLQNDIDELEMKRADWEAGANRRVREEAHDFIQDDAELHYQAVFFEFMEVVNRLENRAQEITGRKFNTVSICTGGTHSILSGAHPAGRHGSVSVRTATDPASEGTSSGRRAINQRGRGSKANGPGTV